MSSALTPAELDDLRSCAASMNLTQSEFIRQALREKIERAGRQFGSDTRGLPSLC